MRRLLSAVLSLALILFPIPPSPCFSDDDVLDASASFAISNQYIFAHGCAVDGYLLTAAHNLDPRGPRNLHNPLVPMYFRYEFRGYHGGIAKSLGGTPATDIGALMFPTSQAPVYAKRGSAPKVGDRIRWVEYDWRKAKDWMQPRSREAKVTSISMGIIIIDREVNAGASGGCAFNDAGEAVGVMTFRAAGEEDSKPVGGVTGFFDGWWETLRLPEMGR